MIEMGSWDGWVGAILSGVAVLVGIALAWWALRAASKLAKAQLRHDDRLSKRQAALDEESMINDRMQELVQHARSTLAEAQKIGHLTSPRIYDLLSIDGSRPDHLEERQKAALESISRLQVEVDLLRIYATTMPAIDDSGAARSQPLLQLMDEGAWVYSDALHCAILAFSADDEDVQLSDDQSVVDALMNGSFVNLNTRLLSDCIGLDVDKIPSFSEPGSPWPAVYQRREQILLNAVMAQKSWKPESLAEAATWALAHSINRLQDALLEVLQEWNSSRKYSDEDMSIANAQ